MLSILRPGTLAVYALNVESFDLKNFLLLSKRKEIYTAVEIPSGWGNHSWQHVETYQKSGPKKISSLSESTLWDLAATDEAVKLFIISMIFDSLYNHWVTVETMYKLPKLPVYLLKKCRASVRLFCNRGLRIEGAYQLFPLIKTAQGFYLI